MAPESSSPVPATTGDEARSDDLGRVGSDFAQDQSAAQADRLIDVVQKNKREQSSKRQDHGGIDHGLRRIIRLFLLQSPTVICWWVDR